MGLLSSSANIRNQLEAKNSYSATKPYDINNNVVNNTLATLASAGYNLNPSASAAVDDLVQQTPLGLIGAQRLAIEIGRRALNNTTSQFSVNPNALFDKNPSTSVISSRTSFQITPNTSTTTVGSILDYIQGAVGITNQDVSTIFLSPSAIPGGIFYYNNLGQGQKQQLNTQIGYNYYGVWAKVNTNPPTGVDSRINTFLDGRTGPGANQGYMYTLGAFDFDKTSEIDYYQDLKYTKAQQGTAPNGFIETLTKPLDEATVLDKYGFGRTTVDNNSNNTQYRDTSQDMVWGDESTYPANMTRGLLYYTQNIVKTNTLVGQLMNQLNSSYTDGNKVIYKGTECRSWTVRNQYDSLGKAIRYAGNNVPYSVLKDNVLGHQYPRVNDGVDDARRYMLSFENLAWTKNDLDNMGVPDCERGPNNGRIMWFPFYGVKINEQTKAEYESTRFIGRIEPVFSYGGVERNATLSFTLLMDYPNTIASQKGNEANYFANCSGVADNSFTQTTTNVSTIGNTISNTTDKSSTPTTSNSATFNELTYFFDNDVFNIDLSYETSQVPFSNTPLNQNFQSNATTFAQSLATSEADGSVFNIKGYASQLASTDYNAVLGFERAYNLMIYLVNQCNAVSTSNQTNLNPVGTTNFVSTSFSEKTVADVNTTDVVFLDTNRNITFNLYSAGESVASTAGANASQINSLATKQDRYAVIDLIASNIPNQTTAIVVPQPATNIQSNIDNINNINTISNVNPTSNCTPFKEIDPNAPNPVGFEGLSYFRPAFHSQTPEDFHKRLTFLQQILRPGSTIKSDSTNQGKNSIFGKAPFCVLRIGDFFHTKVVVFDVNIEYEESWDMNPEGMGMQPMVAHVTMSLGLLGGQSLYGPISAVQNAVNMNFYANSTMNGPNYYGTAFTGSTISSIQTASPYQGPYAMQQMQQLIDNNSNGN